MEFLNKTITDGIIFRMNPTEDDSGNKFKVYLTLADLNPELPMEETYTFNVKVDTPPELP